AVGGTRAGLNVVGGVVEAADADEVSPSRQEAGGQPGVGVARREVVVGRDLVAVGVEQAQVRIEAGAASHRGRGYGQAAGRRRDDAVQVDVIGADGDLPVATDVALKAERARAVERGQEDAAGAGRVLVAAAAAAAAHQGADFLECAVHVDALKRNASFR